MVKKMKNFIFLFLLLFFLGCSNSVVVVKEGGEIEYYKNGKKIENVEELKYIDNDLLKVLDANFGESLYLLERLNKEILIYGKDSFGIHNKNLLFKEKNGYSFLCIGIIKAYNDLSKLLIALDKNIINYNSKFCTPLEAAIKSKNLEMIDYLLKFDNLDIFQKNYIQLSLENNLADIAFIIFEKKYHKNDDYYTDFLKFLSNEKFTNSYKKIFFEIQNNLNQICKLKKNKFLKNLKENTIKKFVAKILKRGELDFSYHCAKNDYFALKNFKNQNPQYKPNLVNKQLKKVLEKQALEKLSVAEEYLKLYPNSKYSSKIKQKLEYLMLQKAIATKDINIINEFIKKYPHSIYISDAKEAIYKIEKDNALNYFKNKIFSGCEDFHWEGKYDNNNGYPIGEGYFTCKLDLYSQMTSLLSRKFIFANLKIYTNIKNKKPSSGKIVANIYEDLRGFLLFSSPTHLKRRIYYFNSLDEVYNILYKLSRDTKELLQQGNNLNCSDMANRCIKTCKYKSDKACLLYTSPSPRDRQKSRMPSSA
jgi:hypothetical protein